LFRPLNDDRNNFRYTPTQILSVILVTFGVALTTFSASGNTTEIHTTVTATKANRHTYTKGIVILIIALLLSGFLGLVQDWTYARYSRPGHPAPPGNSDVKSNPVNGSSHNLRQAEKNGNAPVWQESMFYLHFLALPMFISIRKDLTAQFNVINAGPRFSFLIPFPAPFRSAISPFIQPNNSSFISMSPSDMDIHIPKTYLLLLMNTLTQLLCVAGVHRLTTRLSALSVTLVLVVRKAASLVLSVVGMQGWWMDGDRGWEMGIQGVNVKMMGVGAVMVLLGSVGYSVATSARGEDEKQTKEKRE
jgi:solute carrier family 35 (UDP-xylose/UDP-N-acetylglucosamine transporter), member B4